jgi:hypothetical protein
MRLRDSSWIAHALAALAMLTVLVAQDVERSRASTSPSAHGRIERPTLRVSPEATRLGRMAPGGTTFGVTTPQRNLTGFIGNPPPSPTPPGFPFGPPGGSWVPAGPSSVSGPEIRFYSPPSFVP